jgi:DNA-binding XRE family transcriptional regulator
MENKLLVESIVLGDAAGMEEDVTHVVTSDGRRLVLLSVDLFESLSSRARMATSGKSAFFAAPPEDVSADLLAGYSPLAAWRRRRGLSQTELSELSGVSRHTIMRMEAGGRGAGSPHSRRRVADALGVEIGAL